MDVRKEVLAGDLASGNDGSGRPAKPAAGSQVQAQLGDSVAPTSSITGATTSQSGPGGGGLDTLEVACVGDWGMEAYKAIVPLLERAKAGAQSEGCNWFDHPDGGRVLVRPAGYRRGGVLLVEWVLEFDGITVGLARTPIGTPERPNVFISLGSLVLMQLGHREAWAQALRLLSCLGCPISRAVPSRVDLCVDLPDHSMAEYAEKYKNDAYICRARHDEWFRENKQVTGLVFGRGIRARIYDKPLECGADPAKWAVLVDQRYAGHVPEFAVRVEFQLRRDELREMWSIDDVRDLFDKLPQMAKELTEDWLRFTESPVDRDNNHQSRAETWEGWLRVQRLFAEVFAPNGVEAPRAEQHRPSATKLLRQAWGCLKSACAVLGVQPRDAGELFVQLESRLHSVMERDWWLQLQRRAELFRALKPVNAEDDDLDPRAAAMAAFWSGIEGAAS